MTSDTGVVAVSFKTWVLAETTSTLELSVETVLIASILVNTVAGTSVEASLELIVGFASPVATVSNTEEVTSVADDVMPERTSEELVTTGTVLPGASVVNEDTTVSMVEAPFETAEAE